MYSKRSRNAHSSTESFGLLDSRPLFQPSTTGPSSSSPSFPSLPLGPRPLRARPNGHNCSGWPPFGSARPELSFALTFSKQARPKARRRTQDGDAAFDAVALGAGPAACAGVEPTGSADGVGSRPRAESPSRFAPRVANAAIVQPAHPGESVERRVRLGSIRPLYAQLTYCSPKS